jgi:hypothetical protein
VIERNVRFGSNAVLLTPQRQSAPEVTSEERWHVQRARAGPLFCFELSKITRPLDFKIERLKPVSPAP